MLMKQTFFFAVFLSTIFSLVSCSGSSSEDALITEDSTDQKIQVDPVEVSWQELQKDSIEPETAIIFEGYIGDPGSLVDQSNGGIVVPVYERRNQKAGFELNLFIPLGTGKNQIKELPAEFLPTDLQIFADDNSVLTIGSKIRVTATKSETILAGYVCADVIKIESPIGDFDPVVFANAVMLTAEMMNDTALHHVYCYVDGKLDIPSIVFAYTNEISLDLKNSSVKDITTMPIRLGEGPSTMNDFPDNYTSADLILRDYLGKEIKYKSTVRLYGVWERYTYESSTPGTFYLEEIEVKK
jgi:hypothetical protein